MTYTSIIPQTLIGKTFGIPTESIAADLDLQDDKDEALQNAFSNQTGEYAMLLPEEETKDELDEHVTEF